jgi:hypothetical protein
MEQKRDLKNKLIFHKFPTNHSNEYKNVFGYQKFDIEKK